MENYSVGILIVLLCLLIIYLIPSIIAIERKSDSKLLIILLNVFLGWSLVCWVIALIWSLTKNEQPQEIFVSNKKEEVNLEQLEKLSDLLQKNIITETEFEVQKKKILNSIN